jgi:hypothetical protein
MTPIVGTYQIIPKSRIKRDQRIQKKGGGGSLKAGPSWFVLNQSKPESVSSLQGILVMIGI